MSGKAESAASAVTTDRSRSMRRVGSVLHLLGVRQIPAAEIQIFLAIIVLAILFSYAFPDSFATSGTLLNMARVAGIMLVVSIGQSFALIVGGFDISVGATMGLSKCHLRIADEAWIGSS